jgi:colanic acid biosynthesis glycosyl transferase WcaI
LREGSPAARFLHALSRFSFRHAQKIIALDRFMRQRIEGQGIPPEKIAVIPPWSHDAVVRFDPAGRAQFRAAHGLTDKFVVMYSGNHSPCHPLDTLLDAARKLAPDPRFVFVFVGGGSEWRKIKENKESRKPKAESEDQPPISRLPTAITPANCVCLPYQPLDQLGASLSAADLHVVAMGEPFVGVVHPCKIYNLLGVGAPVLYLGPVPSHLSEILGELASRVCTTVAHGEVDRCVGEILRLAAAPARGEAERYAAVARKFGQLTLLPCLVAELEKLGGDSLK